MTTEKANAHDALIDTHDKEKNYDHDGNWAGRRTPEWRGPRAQGDRDDGARGKTKMQQPRSAQPAGGEGTLVLSYCT